MRNLVHPCSNGLVVTDAMRLLRTTAIGLTLFALGGLLTSTLVSAFTPSVVYAQPAATPPDPEPPATPDPAPAAGVSSYAGEGTEDNKNLWDATWGCIANAGNCALDAVLIPVGGIAYVFLAIAGTILGFAAASFDYAISIFVFKFAIYFGNSAGMLVGWAMLRDIGNIMLVFGFVSIGIQTILNVGHYSVGKALPRLIIFAVLLNFSLFAAEAVIDTTNAVASTIFQQAYECGSEGECTGAAISNRVMVLTGINSFIDTGGAFYGFFLNGEKMQRIIATVLGTIFIIVVAAVLFFGALLLLSRAIMLAFLMITSPIGFAGMAIPQLNKMANQWWSALIKNALFAPALLLMMFVSLKIAEGVSSALSVGGKTPNIFDALFTSATTLDFGGVLVYLLTVGFMFGSLLAAKQFGVFGSDWAVKQAGSAIGLTTAGAWARAGRFGLGRPMNRMATGVRGSNFYRNNPALGAILAKGLDAGATKSFDIRGAKGNIKIAGVSLGNTGDFSKEGRRGELKKIAERASKEAEMRKKAFEAIDAPLQSEIKTLAKDAEVEKAKSATLGKEADQYRKAAERDAANGFEKGAAANLAKAEDLEREARGHDRRAEELDREKKAAEGALKQQQLARLSKDDQILQKYKAGGGSAATEERELKETVAENSQKMENATAEISRLTESLEKMQSDIRDGYVRPEDKAQKEREIESSTMQLEAAQTQYEAANALREEARRRLSDDKEQARRKKIREGAQKQGGEMLESKYGMVQIAERFEKAARSFEGAAGTFAGPVSDSLRTMASGIRADAGQSKEAKLAHELQHMLEHAQHAEGGAHDDAHAAGDNHKKDAKADAGGGDGHGPAH